MPTQPLASFPGVNQLLGCSFTLSHGITPNVATLTIAPQDGFEGAGGTLSLFDGQTQIDFPNCKLDRHALEYNSQGQIWRLQILDRRWKWRWGYISGSYNLRNDDNTIKPQTEQTPQQLASLCLRAMGETDFDVSRMPNDARPTVEWDIDVPAEALAQLCDSLGCRVILHLDDSVSVDVVGQGDALPIDSLVIDNSLTIDPPEQPDTLSVACGRDRFQADFELEAVGLDNDNTLQPIDNLSYKPANGWGACDIPAFSAVADNDRQRAKESVFRWYRIKMPATLPDFGAVGDLNQILPIENEQIDTVAGVPDQFGNPTLRNKPAQVYGVFFKNADDWKNNILPANIDPNGFDGTPQEYRKPFTIDRDLGLMKFADYVFRNSNDTGDNIPDGLSPAPAILRLRVAVTARDPDTRAPIRWHRDRSYGDSFGTPTRYLRHDEIVQTHVPVYDANFNIRSVTTNIDEVNQRCDYYLDAAEQQYQVTFPQTIQYANLRAIELDGAIQQVTWRIGDSGCTTTASRNDEQLHLAPSYEEKRALEKTKLLKHLADANRPGNLCANLKAIAMKS